jgi:putative transposase
MPSIKVYLHFVWSTKNRIPFLSTPALRKKVWNHIKENAKKKNIFLDYVGGHADHCHCLVSLGSEHTLKQIAQLLKGESSFWINKEKLCDKHFNWQDDYFVVAVSESKIKTIRNYIKNQAEHHKEKSFTDEYNDFLEKHGFERLEDGFG